jgi:hypothetical protein
MKKSVLILALAICSYANAQKGTILVLGNVGYFSEKLTNSGTAWNKSFNFSPKVGFQYNDNITVGVESSITNSKNTYNSSNVEYKMNYFSVGAFGRYSKPIGGIFSAYADLGIGYQNEKQRQYNEGIDPFTFIKNGVGFYVGITPALFLNINKGFGINFNLGSIGYSTMNFDDSVNDVHRFNFSFGQAFSVGISKNF